MIISTTGLGDTLWGTPAIRTLRQAHPNAYIGVITSLIGKQILETNPHITQLFPIADPIFLKLPSLYKQLSCQHITDVILFHTSQRALLPLAATLGACILIGTQGLHKGLDHLLTHPIPNTHTHEIERRLHLISRYHTTSPSPLMEIHLTPQDILDGTQAIPKTDQKHKIALHPGAKDLFKQWPPSLFIQLGNQLMRTLSCQLFITGTPAETSLINTIASQIPGSIPMTTLPLRPFAAFLKKMDLLISNDTGPMHIGFAMQTPTIALFAPTDPHLCGPHPPSLARLIAKPRTCTPCLKKKCAEPFCLLQITPQEIYDAILQHLLPT